MPGAGRRGGGARRRRRCGRDLASLDQTRALGEAARDEGPFDVVIHNAGVGGATRPGR